MATAGRDLTIEAGVATLDFESRTFATGKTGASKTTTATHDTLASTRAQASQFSGDTLLLQAGRDVAVVGSNAVSTAGTTVVAGRDLTITAAQESTRESHERTETKKGLMGAGTGFTYGTQEQGNTQTRQATQAAGSTVGSVAGDVTLVAGGTYHQEGSAVMAPQGDVTILAKKVEIVEARQSEVATDETRFKQAGLTVAVSGGAVSAVQTGMAMKDAAKTSGDARMTALAVAAGGLGAASAVADMNQAMTQGDSSGGIALSITVGGSQNQSKTTTTSETAAGSSVQAGGRLTIQATGAGADSTVTVRGSDLNAGGNALIAADGKISLEAARNDVEQKTRSSSSSAAAGVTVGYSNGQAQFGITASGSVGRGSADGADTTWTNTHVNSGGVLTLQSGGDTVLKGAVVSGQRVVGDIGGKLIVESLQDTSTYASKDWNVAASASYGAGSFQANVSASQTKVSADLASVREQSAIRAGDGGFQIKVKDETVLAGGAISSTQAAIAAGANRLETAAVVTSDLANHASFKAQAISVSAGTGGASVGASQKSGEASSVTAAGVSGAELVITDAAKQQALTGQSGEVAVASLNRQVTTGVDTSGALTKTWDEQKLKEQVQANAAITQQTSKIAIDGAIDASRTMGQSKFVQTLTDENGKILLDKNGRPMTAELSAEQKANLAPNADGKITVFTNGIFNSPEAAAKYAVQMSELPAGSKVYLVEFPQANSFVGELMVAGYQKMLEGTVGGLTSATQEVKGLIQQYGESGLNLVGHSRGSMTIGNAMSALERETPAQSVMGNTSIKFVGPAYNAETAVQQLFNLSGGQQTSVVLQNHADDFVGTLLGWNPATYDKRPEDSSKLQEWARIPGNAPTVHSCYGTGAVSSKCEPNYGTPVSVDIRAPNLLRPTAGGSIRPPATKP